MKKLWIWILIVCLTIVLGGIIGLQLVLIRNSIITRQQQFNQKINSTLSSVVIRLTKKEIIDYISDNINFSQIDSNYYSLRFKGSELNSSKKKVLVDNILSRMLNIHPRIENRINKTELEQLLIKSFSESGVMLEFEYAVTKWETELVYFSDDFKKTSDYQYYKVQLFPDDIYSESNYLVVYFPDKDKFIFKSLRFIFIASFSLVAFLIITFVFLVYIIFKQKKLSEVKNDFVSNMTHELKTPISTISLASQMLSDKSIPGESKNLDYLSGLILEESKKLSTQVEKVLQMAVFDRGRIKLKVKKIDIHEIISSVANNFALQMRNKNGKIDISFKATKYELVADQVHITNVITNLIDNAIKYCNKEPKILISTHNSNGHLVISIKDNGLGISNKDQKKIFDKFYRIPTGNIHDVKGFGLGLSYVKKIIEEHKGFIKLESELYMGSTFSIFLPLKSNYHD